MSVGDAAPEAAAPHSTVLTEMSQGALPPAGARQGPPSFAPGPELLVVEEDGGDRDWPSVHMTENFLWILFFLCLKCLVECSHFREKLKLDAIFKF